MAKYCAFDENFIVQETTISETEPDYGSSKWYLVPEEIENCRFFKLVDETVVALDESEIREYYESLTNKAFFDNLRVKTSNSLLLTDWLVQRHTEQVSAKVKTSLNESEFNSLISWRQKMRDISNSTHKDPSEITIPEYPLKSRYPLPLIDNEIDFPDLDNDVPKQG
jgi:hypothetical protein